MDAIIRASKLSGVAHQLQRAPRAQSLVLPVGGSPANEAPLAQTTLAVMTLEQAQTQAILILESAREEAALGAAALREEATLRGYEEGLARGELAGRAPLDAQRERVAELAASLMRSKAAVLADGEDAMVELAFAVVCKVVGDYAASQSGIAALVRQHSAKRHEREQVVIRLHPDDFALLQDGDSALAVNCRADATIELGGCIVDSGSGSLDARLETQMTRLRETLMTVRTERVAGGAAAGQGAG